MNNIVAGIVLYNPDIARLKENVNAILPQVDFIILIDNSSDNIDEIESEYCKINNIYLKKNEKNIGIAKALNQIVHFCEQKNCEWVLILDQDSIPPNNLIENYEKYIFFEKVGIITIKIIDRNYLEENSSISKELEPKYEYIEKCITSASFINIQLCKKIGYFDEKMFIDLVDFEYCIRLRKAGYKILRLNYITLLHQLGNLKVYSIFGKKIRITNHSKIRDYYYARNSLYYLKKHRDYLDKKEIYSKLLIKMLKVLFFERSKKAKFKAMLLGIKDGIKMN